MALIHDQDEIVGRDGWADDFGTRGALRTGPGCRCRISVAMMRPHSLRKAVPGARDRGQPDPLANSPSRKNLPGLCVVWLRAYLVLGVLIER